MHRADVLLGQLEGREDGPLRAANAHARWPRRQRAAQQGLHLQAAFAIGGQPLAGGFRHSVCLVPVQELQQALGHDFGGVFAARGQHVFAMQRCLQVQAAQHQGEFLLDVFGLALFKQQHGRFVFAKIHQLVGHQRIRHIHHQHRQAGHAKRIGQVELLQCAHERVVETALHDQTQVSLGTAFKVLVQALLGNVLACGGQAVFDFAFFLRKGHRRVRQAHVVETSGFVDQVFFGQLGGLVVLGHKLAAHMASADAQLHHHRHVGGFRQPETVLHHVDHLAQLRPRVEQAHARLERIGVCALLNDAGAFAVVFAHHDQHAPGHTG